MPYNTTAIPPRKEATGTNQLPCKHNNFSNLKYILTTIVSRVKKIIALDSDINICSNNAAFVITVATVKLTLSVYFLQLLIPFRRCSFNTWQRKVTTSSSLSENLAATFNTVIFVSYPIPSLPLE